MAQMPDPIVKADITIHPPGEMCLPADITIFRPGTIVKMRTTGTTGIDVRVISAAIRGDCVVYEVAWMSERTRNCEFVQAHELYAESDAQTQSIGWFHQLPQDKPEEPPPPPKTRVPGGYTAIDDAILLLHDLKDFCHGQGATMRARECKRTIAAIQEMQKAEPPKPEIPKSLCEAINKAIKLLRQRGQLLCLGRVATHPSHQKGRELIDLAAELRQELSLVTAKD